MTRSAKGLHGKAQLGELFAEVGGIDLVILQVELDGEVASKFSDQVERERGYRGVLGHEYTYVVACRRVLREAGRDCVCRPETG